VASHWPVLLVSLALGVGPLLSGGRGLPSAEGLRRAVALVVVGFALFTLLHAWSHVGLATVPVAVLGLLMAHQIHHPAGVGVMVAVVGVGLLAVHMLLDGAALAVHDEAAMPWLIGLHRLPVGVAVMAMATDRYGPVGGRFTGALVIVGLIGLTFAGYGVAFHIVGPGSEVVSGLTEAFVVGGVAHVGLGALGSLRRGDEATDGPRQ